MRPSREDVIGIGIDIVERKRVEHIRFLGRFAEFFLTSTEIALFKKHRDRVEFAASRFALKEAVIKAFPGFLSPHDFEVTKRGKKPIVRFFDRKKQDRYEVLGSISHSTDYAAGYAIILKK